MPNCLICNAPISSFVSFGKMPIANGFLQPDEFAHEFFYDLEASFCRKCTMVQLTQQVDPAKLFHENYVYFSSISVRMSEHFRKFAEQVQNKYMSVKDPFVVEIGSNDGIMLQHFARKGLRCLGVEPSANVAQAAIQNGVNTICQFFNERIATNILQEHGPADVIFGANVICHISDIHSVVRSVRTLLKEEGFFIFEEPYLGDIVQNVAYDQIYDEHVFYFSVSSLAYLFAQYGMEIVDILPQNVHGGSLRYVVSRKGLLPVKPCVAEFRAREVTLGLTQEATFAGFRVQILKSRDQLCSLLKQLRSNGKTVVGYGATSKSTVVINFCGIGPDLLDYISDTTPTKQGKYSPGMHIPVVSYDWFRQKYPDYALLLAWNHGEEILDKEQHFLKSGGKFISFVPSVRIMD